MGPAPAEVSAKPNVFELKTPLRTWHLKARHEADAVDWAEQMAAAQRGIALEKRHTKMSKFDVHHDELAQKLQAGSALQPLDVLRHPVGVHYAAAHCSQPAVNPPLAKLLRSILNIQVYKRTTLPHRKLLIARTISRKYVARNPLLTRTEQEEIHRQIERDPPSLPDRLFGPLEQSVLSRYGPLFDDFVGSSYFQELLLNLQRKVLLVQSPSVPEHTYVLDSSHLIGRSKVVEKTGICLFDDMKVSREHARVEVGRLAIMVRDLGSSKGTRLGSPDGPRVLEEIIMPNECIFVGDTKLTYMLQPEKAVGSAKSDRHGSKGFLSMFRPASAAHR